MHSFSITSANTVLYSEVVIFWWDTDDHIIVVVDVLVDYSCHHYYSLDCYVYASVIR